MSVRLLVALPLVASLSACIVFDNDPPHRHDGEGLRGDADGDGFSAESDCDDEDPWVNPAAEEVCGDGVDNDCDGWLDVCRFPEVFDVATAEAIFVGDAAGDEFGGPLRGVGDVDRDGRIELAFSARGDDEAAEDAGAIYLTAREDSGIIRPDEHTAKLLGEAAGDQVFGVWGVGDADGDGRDDLVVSAQRNDDAGEDAGKVYVVPGDVRGVLSLGEVAVAEVLGEAAGDRAGILSHIGDADNDGAVDLLVAAVRNAAGGPNAGAVYLAYGPFRGQSSLADAEVKLTGAQGDRLGGGLAGVGDVDGDGFQDFLVGAPYADAAGDRSGVVYLVLGPVLGHHPATDVAAATYAPRAAGDEAGWGLAPAGDHDGDGLDDFLISAQKEGEGDEGAIYLVTSATRGEVALADVRTRLQGQSPGDALSNSHGGGDVNSDGRPDIVLGARLHDGPGEDSGVAWLLLGPVPAGSHVAADIAETTFVGAEAGDGLGAPAHIAGDVDGDGADDILLGARWSDLGGDEDLGVAYLVLGMGG